VSLSAIFVPKGNPLVELLSQVRMVAASSSGWTDPTVAILGLCSQFPLTYLMGLIELLILLGLGVGTARFISKSNRRKRLEAAFYQLLRQQDSCISLIQLMTISQVSSQDAKLFLDAQVRLLDGIPEVDDDGDTFYRFPKLKLPAAILDDDW
jgi:hypothetical protein